MSEAQAHGLILSQCQRADDLIGRHVMETEVQSGSVLADDDRLTHPYRLSHAVHSALTGSNDHLQAVVTAMSASEGVRPVSPYSLCRAAVENAANALYLIAPEEQNDRVRRRLQLAAADRRDAAQVYELVGMTTNKTLDVMLTAIGDLGEAAGLTSTEVLARGKGWAEIVKAGDAYIADGHHGCEIAWRICSGFTHARSWATLATLERGEPEKIDDDSVRMPFTANFTAMAQATLSALALVERAVKLYDHRRKRWTTVTRSPKSGAPATS